MKVFHGSALAILMLGACARTPDVIHPYYPTTSTTIITITQSIDCNAAKTQLFTVETPQVTTTYSADLAKAPFVLRIKDLDGLFADSDIKLGRTEDGRLQSIDESTTGQGAAIIKSAVSVAASAAAIGGGATPPPLGLPECKVVATSGGGKPVTLTYTTRVDLSQPVPHDNIPLTNSPSDKELYDALSHGGLMPILDAELVRHPIVHSSAQSLAGDIPITLQATEDIQINFRRNGSDLGSSLVVVPTNETYELPIPRPAVFGKQSFALVLSASGAITSIEYGKTTGSADAANSLTSILSAPSTITTDLTASTKADSDLIVQQQRHVRCLARPETCS